MQGNRLPRILITVLTLSILMVNFCLGLGGDAGFGIARAGGADGMFDSFISPPVDEPALLIQMEDRQFMPLRTGFQRVFNFYGIHGITSAFYQPAFMINSSKSYTDIKDIILLKLRI